MKRKIIKTADGSTTIHLPDWDESYHSKHGAIQEAYHVFIKHGLHHLCHSVPKAPDSHRDGIISDSGNKISILEIGFGTGLNAFITLLEAEKLNLNIDYVGVEGYPVALDEIRLLNYPSELNIEDRSTLFEEMHQISWESQHQLGSHFKIEKQHKMFDAIADFDKFHLIYFDAFGARVQPELWTESIFKKMYDALQKGGVLVTYAAKGSVRRAMQSVGFQVEKLPGPPGKREMLRSGK
ncbi:tRNA (5-methylaminomethyl-2-thiouridine)(34)-methyltransferase MnmD [Hyunsoonleella sp. SJ7]|uniref:tRNA (5-methylaminomethyl-2-thiouridine)(34)-methyltransferase MnmD n=1 Tax=Hyunsoonleella aquatilis TaxID=2762758 RepID=A0A923HAK0_9FLAO|nr:tRNA (5-methylaminomethyl-2-thiouridine)(34)-methyltransferase MnmD [Hyunsoonleella aquatilis]MBC3758824.1 tRNA (5-methylaminomethyl-2-thiouridine)(34)-methyltransferase MnmD [Hyunsoonleella aquatilis]